MIPVQVSRTKIKDKFYCFYGKIPARGLQYINRTNLFINIKNRMEHLL